MLIVGEVCENGSVIMPDGMRLRALRNCVEATGEK